MDKSSLWDPQRRDQTGTLREPIVGRRAPALRLCGFALLVWMLLAREPTTSWALVWPDVAEKVARDLSAADPPTRRGAARELRALGRIRGAPLAVAALDDPDDEVRLAAADASIRLRAQGATEVVAAWLNAPDARLRRKACEVARALPSPRAVAPLARTLGDPDPEVRAAAADALGHQASASAVPPLLGRLDDPTPAVRIQIVGALARLSDARAVVPLVGKVQDSSAEVRQAVARALGDLGDSRASSALVLGLRDQNTDVQRETLAALGRMHAADAVDAIAQFAGDRTPSLRLAALAALGSIASPDALRVLVGALGRGDDSSGSLERTPVRDALVAAGVASVQSMRVLLAGSPSAAAATSAAWILGEEHARAEAPSIVAAMRRGVLPTTAALHALAGAGGPAEVPVVLEFISDPSPLVRDEALSVAMALLDPNRPDGRAVEPLAAALQDVRPSAQERVRLATLLGRTGAPRAASVLVQLVRSGDSSLRLAAIDALGTIGPADGVDGPLLEALDATDTSARLHAAMALSEAGGAHARDALLAKLEGGDEVDRTAILTALGGILVRVPSEAAVARLTSTLELAAGPERDAIIEALGRAPLASAVRSLANVARSNEPADRRAAAAICAAQGGDHGAVVVARGLLGDGDDDVRAQAAWSLGVLGDASDIERLESLARGADADVATDATAAIGRIASRGAMRAVASRVLCQLASDGRAYVRANALAGLALAGALCGGGALERRILGGDPSDDARAAAARALRGDAGPASSENLSALERCARSDASGTVAAYCRARPPLPSRAHPALVYVVPEGASAPRPGAPYAMLLADGLLHTGTTDRRGAVFDPVAPEGEATLRRPSVLAR